MGKQLAIEFRRVLKSPTFYIALFISLYIAISQVIEITIPLSKGNDELESPHSVFMCMMGMGRGWGTWHQDMLHNLTPILVALPFGASFYKDRKSGYIKNLFIREKKGAYLWSKYIATFVSGGFVIAASTFVNFIGNCMFVPLFNPVVGSGIYADVAEYMRYLYYEMPVIYILCVCLLQFVIGGLLATTCLGVTYLVDLVFLIQLFPVIFVYVYDMIANSIEAFKFIMFYNYLSTTIDDMVSIQRLVTIVAIMLVFSFVYFYNGYKEETL